MKPEFEKCYSSWDGSTRVKPTLRYFVYAWQTSETVEEVGCKLDDAYRDPKVWTGGPGCEPTWWDSLGNWRLGSLSNRASYWRREEGINLKNLPLRRPVNRAQQIEDLREFAQSLL